MQDATPPRAQLFKLLIMLAGLAMGGTYGSCFLHHNNGSYFLKSISADRLLGNIDDVAKIQLIFFCAIQSLPYGSFEGYAINAHDIISGSKYI